jgi:hypothetical protein
MTYDKYRDMRFRQMHEYYIECKEWGEKFYDECRRHKKLRKLLDNRPDHPSFFPSAFINKDNIENKLDKIINDGIKIKGSGLGI